MQILPSEKETDPQRTLSRRDAERKCERSKSPPCKVFAARLTMAEGQPREPLGRFTPYERQLPACHAQRAWHRGSVGTGAHCTLASTRAFAPLTQQPLAAFGCGWAG